MVRVGLCIGFLEHVSIDDWNVCGRCARPCASPVGASVCGTECDRSFAIARPFGVNMQRCLLSRGLVIVWIVSILSSTLKYLLLRFPIFCYLWNTWPRL